MSCVSSVIYRKSETQIQSYESSYQAVGLNHSDLYNSMIHPFTRLVIYGIIWYQGNDSILCYNFLFSIVVVVVR